MYNKIDISNVPSTKRKQVGYRTNISSSDINEFNDNVLNDLLDLFNKTNNISKELEENKMIIDSETNHLKFKIKRLEEELETVKSKYDSILSDNKIHTKYIYPTNIVSENTNSTSYIDTVYNSITLTPLNTQPKTYIFDEIYNKSFIPPTLFTETEYVNINPKIDIISETENEINNCLCGENNKYWIRQVTTNSDIKEITCRLKIVLPDNIITTRDINEILIKPYPTNAIDIVNVEYINLNDIKNILPAFSEYATKQSDFNILWNEDTEEYELIDVDSLKFNFKDIPVTQLVITFRQKYYTKNLDDTNTFTFGFKNIDIRNNKYSNTTNTFQFKVDFKTNKVVTLNEINPIIVNDSQIDNKSIVFDYYTISESGEITKIFDSLPFICLTDKILVKGRMFSHNSTPNINKFEIKYTLS